MRLAAALAIAAALAAPAAAEDDGDRYACKKVGDKQKLRVSLRPGVTLDDLAAWHASFSCASIVYGEGVGCSRPGATLIVPDEITVAEARQLFLDAIEVMGLRAKVSRNKIVIVEPSGTRRDTRCAVAEGSGRAVPVSDEASRPIDVAPPDLDAHVTKLDDTRYRVKRALIDALRANPSLLARSARVVAAIRDDKPIGFKVYAVRPSSILAKLGFQNGDTIQAIDGAEVTSPEKALELHEKLAAASSIPVTIVRRGATITLTYEIVE